MRFQNGIEPVRAVTQFRAVVLMLVALLAASGAKAAPDFAREVRPLLEQHCFKCHGPEKQKGGLRYDTKEGAFKAGESGEKAIIPGHASESRLIKLISSKDDDERMPPKGEPLSAAQIDLLKRWIDAGAHWLEQATATGALARSEMIVTDEDRKHWSYLPLTNPLLPAVKNAAPVRTPVDRFILAALEEKKLALSPQADARKLARRIYFDLIGLPPTPEQVETFVKSFAANSRSAVASLVDQLLASPHYGERWARHWLDVVRYADSNGSEGDADRPTAYHYRDFVIRAFNEDMPFDTFARWQLAGDELEPNNPRAIAATGFIVAGTHAALPLNLMEEERTRERFNELDDMIATTGSAMLGLTLACARCHDHKYDPVPRRDYYRIQSAFNGGDRAEVPLAPLEEVRRHREADAKWKGEFDAAKKQWDVWLKETKKPHETAVFHTKVDALKVSAAEKLLLKGNPEANSPEAKIAKDLVKKFSKELKVEDKDFRPLLTDEERAEWDSREKAFKAVEARKPKALPTAYGFADFGAKPRETFLLARGDFRAKSEPVELGFLTALTRGKTPADYWATARAEIRRPDSTQQRRALAEWITDTEHGAGTLAARVIVNRVWQHHFGQGLVRTVNDFGARCDPPTHPELLEWLTSEFVKGGWKLKPLHRFIMTSATYGQRSDGMAGSWGYGKANADTPAFQHSNTPTAIDPDNRLLWRRRPQRIESEILRDSMLAVSGTLNLEMFGPAFKAPVAPEAIQARNMKDPYPKDLKDTSATRRRSVYMFHKRVVQQPLMQAFDGPDAQASCGRRENTTVAPQALALLNDKFVRARAMDFAQRVEKEASTEPEAQVRLAWRLALGREPSTDEAGLGTAFIDAQIRQRSTRDSGKLKTEIRQLALADFCQAIFAMNEFVYVD
ncbi:MAG TPA: PSD1 and planctomycete cytochrome C domain-containing protein [Methylomirabilota bacterium]|nr:PSD1 and planctomycete cytochrome C domain-containing protein [Methylomirabilota bacterium]